MDQIRWHEVSAVSWRAVSGLTMANAVEFATTLTASAAMALLVALAGSYLPDLPPASTAETEVVATPRADPLVICTVVAERQQCIEEAS